MPRRNRKRGRGRRTAPSSFASRLSRIQSNPVQTIRVPLSATLPLTTDGSGIISLNITSDPSGGSGSSWTSDEYVYYQDRYSLVRCEGIKCVFTSLMANPDSKLGGTAPAVIAPQLISQAAPTAYQSVEDNFGLKTWSITSDTTSRGMTVYLPHDLKSLGWLPTTAPSAVTGPYAGCPGGIGIYCSGLPISERVGTVTVTGLYEFRSKS